MIQQIDTTDPTPTPLSIFFIGGTVDGKLTTAQFGMRKTPCQQKYTFILCDIPGRPLTYPPTHIQLCLDC